MYQKNFVQGKWAILNLKMAHLHNSGLVLRIFLKFCRMKGANRYMKNLLVVFWEKKIIWGNLIFLAFRPFFTVWLGMVKLNQVIVNWILKQSGHDVFHDYYWIFKQSGMIRILKQWRHDFSGKHLCGGYFMGFIWCLCV